jgi:hypothetical protein
MIDNLLVHECFFNSMKNGVFTRIGWKKLVTKYEEKIGLKLTKKQSKNKLDNMKKEYTWFMEFKNATTSLGWNKAKQTVDCSKDWWDEHLAIRIISCPF